VPFLVVNEPDHPEAPGKDWCTSCGICAKVCPPQCIWIVRSEDPVTNRPVPEPEAFFIDTDICMNCGYCAEFCPFDAIKMDHDYELADYDRTGVGAHIHDKARLSKPYSYWYSIAPTTAVEEAQDRGGWEHTDVIKEKKKSGAAQMEKPWFMLRTEDPEERARRDAEKAAAAAAAASTGPSEAELKAARLGRRMEALARHKAWKP
jgi:formate hydrogenlyase subunit 6/NADH:ubiquinone oxidoreductase subunit I